MNRLAEESSPYLRAHAHNPVDWYPWGKEAFAAARDQNKPIFLSVGYSACYWCHVMERESFENPALAAEMNRLLVSIKVDREERPDVDNLYMAAVQLLARNAGWPMSVFLLPDGRPFYGGTYFPPEDSHGRPGFLTLIRAISDAFHNRRAEVDRSADEITGILKQISKPPAIEKSLQIDESLCNELVRASVADFDPRFGGFGGAPKFPRESLLELLLVHEEIVPDADRMRMTSRTLDAMADGGIRDHLGGGFHRYSTDARWLVPHFEIMLYDNAMLGWIYTEASRRLKSARFARVARGIFDFVLRDMTSPQGAFCTAIDAETDAREGATYLWTMPQVVDVLGAADAERFARVYGLDAGPNFADPHHGDGRPQANVLYLPHGAELENDPAIASMRQRLLAARKSRPQPKLDDKILTAWNGLMIRALAHASVVLEEPQYLDAASRAADWLVQNHRREDGTLLRTSRGTPAKLNGHLDDYAFLIQALLELAAAGQPRRRVAAHELADQMLRRFGDGGALYFTDSAEHDLIVRQKLCADSPLPSGNGVAAQVLLALGDAETARAIVADFAAMLDDQPQAMSALVQAAAVVVAGTGPITVAPPATSTPRPPAEAAEDVVSTRLELFDEQTIELTLVIREGYHLWPDQAPPGLIPTQVTLLSDVLTVKEIQYPWGVEKKLADGEAPARVYEKEAEIIIVLRPRNDGGAKAKIQLQYQACNDRACLAPVTSILELDLPRGRKPPMSGRD